MNLTRLALKRPVSAVLFIVMIVVFGFSSYCSLEQELTPEMESPMLLVMTIYSGHLSNAISADKHIGLAVIIINGVQRNA